MDKWVEMARTPPQPFTQTLTEEGTRAAQELRRDERGAPEGVEGEGNSGLCGNQST